MIRLGLGFTNPFGTRGVLDVCLCLGCGGVGGVGGEWVGVLTRVRRVGWCYVCVRCESGFSVYMAGPAICIFFGGYLRIIGAPSVQSCLTLWISDS